MFQCIPYIILKKGNIEAALPNDNTTKYEMSYVCVLRFQTGRLFNFYLHISNVLINTKCDSFDTNGII